MTWSIRCAAVFDMRRALFFFALFASALHDPNRRQVDVQEFHAGYYLGRWRRRPAWLLRAGRPLDPAVQEA
jgi:hypothetical protein